MPFTGKAVYDTGNWSEIKEDVSQLISMISPKATPLLDALSPPEYEAQSVLHSWLDETLNPNTVVSSTDASTSGTAIGVVASDAGPLTFLTAGTILKNRSTGEFLQVSAISGSTITVSRQFGSTSMSTVAAGVTFEVISDAALEGADVTTDISRPRTAVSNYCQLFKKDVIISGTEMAVAHHGVANEYDHQKRNRIVESLRDLEKVVIQGKLSGNTIGSSSAWRTLKGLWDFVPATNATSTATLTPSILDSVIKLAWDEGAEDLDLIVCDANWKGYIDAFNNSRTQVENRDELFKQRVTYYAGSYDEMRVVRSRWMPQNSLMVLSSERCHVVPMRGRSFHHESVSKTGDSVKGMILGEYTVEVRNAAGMAKAYG